MKIIRFYKNGTIRLPQEIINKLGLQHNDRLVIEAKYDGFVVCKIEYYGDWLKKLDAELLELDTYSRQIFAKSLNSLNKKENKEEKTEVL